MSAPTLTLSERQRKVLLTLYAFERDNGRAAAESDVYYAGRGAGFWSSPKIDFYGPLNRLVGCGLVERSGSRGGYGYALTQEGRDVVARLP